MPETRIDTMQILKNGAMIGLAGGVAEVAVVWSYAAATGADAGAVARGVAASFYIQPGIQSNTTIGIAIHMLLAASLGICLCTMMRVLPTRASAYGALPFMLGSLFTVWAVNFLFVLPLMNPSFVHLLPYGVTLASKLAFGGTAAAMLSYQTGSVPIHKTAVMANYPSSSLLAATQRSET